MLQALILGLTAAITPCNFVLYPTLLYKFGITQKEVKWRELLQFVATFLVVTVLVGFFASYLLSSVTWFKFLWGVVFLLYGLYLVIKPGGGIIPKTVENPFVLGLILPLTVSVSACVLPFFSILVGGGLSATNLLLGSLRFLMFGIGLLAPAMLLALFGQYFLKVVKKLQGILYFVEKVGAFLIIFSGVYILFDLQTFSSIHIWIFTMILVLLLLFMGVIFYKKGKFSKCKGFLILLLLISLFLFHTSCKKNLPANQTSSDVVACGHRDSGQAIKCENCSTCVWGIVALSVLTSGLYLIADKRFVVQGSIVSKM